MTDFTDYWDIKVVIFINNFDTFTFIYKGSN